MNTPIEQAAANAEQARAASEQAAAELRRTADHVAELNRMIQEHQ